jgi:hypothetical protein
MAPAMTIKGALAPHVVFSLDALGLDPARFLAELTPHFLALPWDLYDVKRAQVQRLLDAFPDERVRLEAFLAAYFAEKTDLSALSDLTGQLPEFAPRPHRQRAIGHFRLESVQRKGDWSVERREEASFSQSPMATGDYRALPRVFVPMAEAISENPLFLDWLRAVGEQVRKARPDACVLRVTCHQMRTIARPGVSATNSPEGIHQDGADFIVSALVMERMGVIGGESRVFGPDRETVVLRHTLQPGEGIFQADAGSPLWHDVTPVVASGEGEGVRSLFGLDIRIV